MIYTDEDKILLEFGGVIGYAYDRNTKECYRVITEICDCELCREGFSTNRRSINMIRITPSEFIYKLKFMKSCSKEERNKVKEEVISGINRRERHIQDRLDDIYQARKEAQL